MSPKGSDTNVATRNPPMTAAGLGGVIGLLLVAFTDYDSGQVVSVQAAVTLLATFAATRFTKRA